MNKEIKSKLVLKLFMNFIIIMAVVFTLLVIIFSSFSEYSLGGVDLGREIGIYSAASIIASILLILVFLSKRIPISLQAILVYSVLALTFLVVGYLIYVFDFSYNKRVFISTIVSFVLGGVIIFWITHVRASKDNNTLNSYLKRFKERDK